MMQIRPAAAPDVDEHRLAPAKACDAEGEFAVYVAGSAHVRPLEGAAKRKLKGGLYTRPRPSTRPACQLAFTDTVRVCVMMISFR
jgi:hypothetical protein